MAETLESFLASQPSRMSVIMASRNSEVATSQVLVRIAIQIQGASRYLEALNQLGIVTLTPCLVELKVF